MNTMPEGWFQSSCRVAQQMLNAGSTEEVYFRPDGLLTTDPDSDLAWVKL